jgi:ketosteroid isomerase-like protein
MTRLDVTRWAKRALGSRAPTPAPGPESKNMALMQTLDDAWNNQDWATFERRHAEDTVVRWPARLPTHGVRAHRAEAVQMFKTFPDNRVENRPYKVFFASGDWTCSIARFHGTMRDLFTLADGRMIPPTGRSFEVDFCTVARWRDGKIVEENLFYDVGSMMKQLGIDP